MEISTDERFVASLRYIARKFNLPVKKNGERYKLVLPLTIDQDQYLDQIVHQIVTTMKGQYIHDKIKIKNETLIRILVNYDKKTDIIIATTLIKITPVMLLDAVFDFSISKLKSRWDEVIQLVNENHHKLAQRELFNELLRFLILNMDHKTKEAHVIYMDKRTKVCNAKLEPYKQTDNNIINTLIDIAPQQIFIHVDQNLETNLVKKIQTIFPNCVCIDYGTML